MLMLHQLLVALHLGLLLLHLNRVHQILMDFARLVQHRRGLPMFLGTGGASGGLGRVVELWGKITY